MDKTKLNEEIKLGDLVDLYLQTGDEEYFNKIWFQVKPLSVMIGKKFMTIPYEDKESMAMEVLFRVLRKVNIDKSYSFLTLYGRSLGGEYICYLQHLETKKEQLNSCADSIEKMKEEVNYEPSYEQDDFSLDMFIYDSKLQGLEVSLLTLIYEGYKKTEILKKLNLKREQYDYLLETIKSKITTNHLSEGLSR